MQRRTYAQLAARIPNGIRHFFSWNPSRIRHFFLVESQESLGIPDFFSLESRNPGILESWEHGIMESRNRGILETQNPGILWLFSGFPAESPNYLVLVIKENGLK